MQVDMTSLVAEEELLTRAISESESEIEMVKILRFSNEILSFFIKIERDLEALSENNKGLRFASE